MKSGASYIVLAVLAVLTASPVMAGIVVGFEDFEDDSAVTYNSDPSLFYPGLTGPPHK